MSTKILLASTLSLFAVSFGSCAAEGSPATSKATGEITVAANKFLAMLDDNQRSKVVFDFKDEAQRKRCRTFRREFFDAAACAWVI